MLLKEGYGKWYNVGVVPSNNTFWQCLAWRINGDMSDLESLRTMLLLCLEKDSETHLFEVDRGGYLRQSLQALISADDPGTDYHKLFACLLARHLKYDLKMLHLRADAGLRIINSPIPDELVADAPVWYLMYSPACIEYPDGRWSNLDQIP